MYEEVNSNHIGKLSKQTGKKVILIAIVVATAHEDVIFEYTVRKIMFTDGTLKGHWGSSRLDRYLRTHI